MTTGRKLAYRAKKMLHPFLWIVGEPRCQIDESRGSGQKLEMQQHFSALYADQRCQQKGTLHIVKKKWMDAPSICSAMYTEL